MHLFVAGQSAADRLPKQIGQWKLCVLATVWVGQMPFDECSEPEPFVRLAHPKQATFGGDSWPLELDRQSDVEGEMKGLIVYLTHWLPASGASR